MARWRAQAAQEKARQAAAALKAEYRAGREGDDSAPEPIWATPKEQLDRLLGLLGAARMAPPPPVDEPDAEQAERDDVEAEQVAQALRGVDWAAVRVATSEKASDGRRAMRSLADQVDWAKVQPMAAQVSSALIAAVASGRIGVGGPLGATIARTIAGQSGLAEKVANRLATNAADVPPDFRGAIEATSRDAAPER